MSSFVYRARRPFHPQRLYDMVTGGFLKTTRSKGFCWLATKHDFAAMWSQAGGSFRIEPAGRWWACAPEDRWPPEPDSRAWIRSKWQDPFGDRRQEIVMIGVHLDEPYTRSLLDSCLLTDEELDMGPEVWNMWQDPFPEWAFTNTAGA
ncbi:MAG: GTP-binding protein [Planctomycetota bacterium]